MRYQLNIAKIIVLSRAGDHRSPLQKPEISMYRGVSLVARLQILHFILGNI
ncbi:MAG: hypothetical protein R3Y53_00260 [Bacillota bacterium]